VTRVVYDKESLFSACVSVRRFELRGLTKTVTFIM